MVGLCQDCGKCGKGVPGKVANPVKQELCFVFCQARKEFCELKAQGKKKPRPSKIAENKMRNPATKKRMRRAAARSGFPKGSAAIPEARRPVVWKKPVPKSWKRKPLAGKRLERLLKPMKERVERQVKAKVAQVMKKKIAKKAATAWMKFVPGLNILSTAYDIYDLASTGFDLYKMIDEAMKKFKGNVFEIRPDVLIEGPDGKMEQIYDFKFDGDDWQPGQKELYREATGKDPIKIDQKTCQCK